MRVSLQHKVALGYLIATLVLISILVVEFRYVRSLERDAEAADQTHRMKEHLGYVISLIKDVETGQRGYLITGNEEFRQPYLEAKQALPYEIETIKNLIGDERGQKQIQSLEELINQKILFTDEAIRLQKEKGPAAASAFIQTGAGKRMMDEIRRLSAAMERTESEVLSARIAQKRQSATIAITATSIFVGLNLLVFGFVFVLIRREIKQREDAQNILRRSEEQFKTLVQHAGDVIYSTDPKGYFTFTNPTIERLMAYEPQELLGRHYLDLVAPSWRERVQQFYGRQIRERIVTSFHQHPVVRKDGSEMWIGQTLQLIFEGEKILGTMAVARDVTRTKELQDELARARDTALESARLKSAFLANMSHEIRTPMNGIIGMTNLLADTRLDQDQHNFVDGIRQSADALLQIINGILDFSRIEAGKLEIETEDFNLTIFIEGIVGLFMHAAETKNLELTAIIDPDVPTLLHADASHMRQILINLIGNAIKFTEHGEVTLRIIRLSQTQTNVVLRFEIIDTGVGIAETAQAKLFSAFVQADASTTRRFGGSGLGLAISKRLVEAIGGQIGVASRPGEGSTFWFTLNLRKQAGAGISKALPRTNLQGFRALVVDDQPTNRESLINPLRSWRLDVAEAHSFDETLSALRDGVKSGRHFDFVLIDHLIHGRSGLDLARAIRLEKEIAPVRLILLSAFGQRPSEEMISEAGIRASLIKPVRQSQLYDCLVSVMHDKFGGTKVSESRLTPASVAPCPLAEGAGNKDPRLNGNPRMLVVEDNPINQQVARYQIEKLGYPADLAKDGAKALEMLDQHDYALILMDCHMPGMDGFEATAQIRKRTDDKRRIPIIAVTASGTPGEKEKCLRAGMDDFLLKPFSQEDLARKITALLPDTSRVATTGRSSAGETESHLVKDLADRLSDLEADYGKEMVQKIVEMIVPDTEDRIEKIDRAIKQQDFRALEEAAHGLKSGAANIGATELAQLSAELEERGEAKSMDGAEEVISKLRDSWAKVKIEIARYR